MKRTKLALILALSLCFSIFGSGFALAADMNSASVTVHINGEYFNAETYEYSEDVFTSNISGPDGLELSEIVCNVEYSLDGDEISIESQTGEISLHLYFVTSADESEEVEVEVEVEATENTGLPFEVNREYIGFLDVSDSEWYFATIKNSYELGLMNGKSGDSFEPQQNITVAETITMAARINDIYYNNSADFTSDDELWYSGYIAYAEANGIATLETYDAEISREEFVYIMATALPDAEFEAVSGEMDFADIDSFSYYDSVQMLCKAGIISGYEDGTFLPQNSITRAEAAVLVSRMVVPENRLVASVEEEVEETEEVEEIEEETRTQVGFILPEVL